MNLANQKLIARIDGARLRRDLASYDFLLHRISCKKCDPLTADEISRGFGCAAGAELAIRYELENEAVRNALIAQPLQVIR